MTETDGEFLAGRILVAMPGIGDPRFERAVIYLCAHDADRALGLTVNRPVDGLTLPRILKRAGIAASAEVPEDLVLMGGPVHRENGFVLHTDDYESPVQQDGETSTLKVAGGIALTATRDVLEAIAAQDHPPRKAVMAMGYAGWGPGQLEQELKDNVWLTCEADEQLLFGDDHEHKWSMALQKIGINPEHLSGVAGRA